MDRGRRPVETVSDHGINIGASLAHKEQEQQHRHRRISFLELSGLEI